VNQSNDRPKVFFIVHDAGSFTAHPDLLGFAPKRLQDGTPARHSNGEIVPANFHVREINPGDIIVYYTRGDYLIRGIYRVKERLSELDSRRADDWGDVVQFLIEPIAKPNRDVDFRDLVYRRRPRLHMFQHLENVRSQWPMSIGRRNYIREIDNHDLQLIAEAIGLGSSQVQDIFGFRPTRQILIGQRRESLNPEGLRIQNLNPYEIITLFSIVEKKVGDREIALTKTGGFWPVLLADLSLRYELSDEEIERAARKAAHYYLESPDRLSHRAGTREVEDGAVRTFLRELIFDDDFSVNEFVEHVESEYNKTLNHLSSEGLVEDPFHLLELVILGFVPYAFNRETARGSERVSQVKALFWEYERKTGPQSESIKFNFKLINQFRKFILGFVER
jgi:hypothetical protein